MSALLQLGEEVYEEVCRILNVAIDRRPAPIERCAGADDVAPAIRFAREGDLLVSVIEAGDEDPDGAASGVRARARALLDELH